MWVGLVQSIEGLKKKDWYNISSAIMFILRTSTNTTYIMIPFLQS